MKKAIKIICTILFISIILIGYIWDNLISNSVYYAKNMPKDEGQYPEWVMLIDNMEDIYKPEIEGIEYKIDAMRDIINHNNKEAFGDIYSDETEYIYSDGKEISYRFNKKFKLLNATEMREIRSIDINTVNKDEIISKIDTLLKPVVEAQPKPTINLQWLFNLIYGDDFK